MQENLTEPCSYKTSCLISVTERYWHYSQLVYRLTKEPFYSVYCLQIALLDKWKEKQTGSDVLEPTIFSKLMTTTALLWYETNKNVKG